MGYFAGAGSMTNPTNSCPADETALLRELFAKGLSAGAIALELRNKSRNAVISKLGRLRLLLSWKARGPKRRPDSRKNRRTAPWKPDIIEKSPPTQPPGLPLEPVCKPG